MAMTDTTDKVEIIEEALSGKPDTHWLYSFDPNARNGRGRIVMTDDIDKAKRFPSFQAVMEEWKCQSTKKPLRPDGKPNRPLTAFTIHPTRLP